MRRHVGRDIFATDMTDTFDFSYLDALQVRPTATARFVLQQVRNADGTNPVLIVAPATNENKAFFAAQLELTAGSVARGARIDPESVSRFRKEMRALYPLHIVVGWENLQARGGTAVPFSVETCIKFISSLPDWVFDQLRVFCEAPIHFTPSHVAGPMIDGSALAKN